MVGGISGLYQISFCRNACHHCMSEIFLRIINLYIIIKVTGALFSKIFCFLIRKVEHLLQCMFLMLLNHLREFWSG